MRDGVGVARPERSALVRGWLCRVRYVPGGREATFLDSSGLRLIVEVYMASAADGFELAIVPGPPDVQRAFDVTGLSSRLPFVDERHLARARAEPAVVNHGGSPAAEEGRGSAACPGARARA
jgi:hypothetical protein